MTIRLKVKVVPGASQSGIVGWLGEELKIRVAAPPEKGKANKAVIKILANALKLPAGTLRIVSGSTSAHKVIEVPGVTEHDVMKRLH